MSAFVVVNLNLEWFRAGKTLLVAEGYKGGEESAEGYKDTS